MLDLYNNCTITLAVYFFTFCFAFTSLDSSKLVNIRLFQSFLQLRTRSVVTFSPKNANFQFYDNIKLSSMMY